MRWITFWRFSVWVHVSIPLKSFPSSFNARPTPTSPIWLYKVIQLSLFRKVSSLVCGFILNKLPWLFLFFFQIQRKHQKTKMNMVSIFCSDSKTNKWRKLSLSPFVIFVTLSNYSLSLCLSFSQANILDHYYRYHPNTCTHNMSSSEKVL